LLVCGCGDAVCGDVSKRWNGKKSTIVAAVIEVEPDSKCSLDMRSQDEVDKGDTGRSDNSEHTPEADKDGDREDRDMEPLIC
jgi:hypothetical protein